MTKFQKYTFKNFPHTEEYKNYTAPRIYVDEYYPGAVKFITDNQLLKSGY